jgi:hypothetical protein
MKFVYSTVLFLLFLTLASCSSSCASLNPQGDSLGRTSKDYVSYEFENTDKSTVLIQTFCPEGIGGGTGFAVSNKDIITAKHVVVCNNGQSSEFILVTTRFDEIAYIMEVDQLPTDENTDAARLVAAFGMKPFTNWLKVNPERPKYGTRVCIQTGMSNLRKCGYTTKDNARWSPFITVSMSIIPGDSGSPLVDSNGVVLGIIIAYHTTFNGATVGMAMPAHTWMGLMPKASP